jgi:predicted nucleotide-binding protein (sugar kinase/HSP70/actin superfamily)
VSDSFAGRTIYVPYMADHALAVVAAMRAQGLDAQPLDPPDDETLAIGLDLCRGRECLPCFLVTGDIIRQCRRAGFDRAKAAFLLPTSPGPCRFGQYHVLERAILAREGLGDVRIVAPSAETLYEGFGEDPRGLRRLVWHGFVATDLLLKLLHEYRPYELEPGVADAAYHAALEQVLLAIETGNHAAIVRALRHGADRFRVLPVRREPRRPVVAMLGEIYVMLNHHANHQMIRKLESLGAEVATGSLIEWMLFADWTQLNHDLLFHDWRRLVGTVAQDTWQRTVLHRMHRVVAPLLRQPPDATMAELFALVRPFYDPQLGTEATLTLAKALWETSHGAAGVLNVLPFSCMPGLIVTGMAPPMRQAMGLIPWLDIWYDAQQQTNVQTRLEAFMHQVRQHADRERYAAPPGPRLFSAKGSGANRNRQAVPD